MEKILIIALAICLITRILRDWQKTDMANKRHCKNKLRKRNRKKITPFDIAKMEREQKAKTMEKNL